MRSLPPLYTHENTASNLVPVKVKFFNPYGIGTWYCTEGSAVDAEGQYHSLKTCKVVQGIVQLPDGTPAEDVILYCWADLGHPELGYVSYNELCAYQHGNGMWIERDQYLGKVTLADVMAGAR